jgi:ATP-dependent helicase/nuclease subunit A
VENLGRMARTLAPLAADVEERLRRRGRVTFEMLLSRAAALLHEHPDVAARLRAGIDQLLVDEFQDTDPRQCRIVAALALEGPAATRPGLFVVGDPKQSIYGWRHADLEAYEGLLARMREAGGAVGPLCVNYRSVPAVLEEVERVVAPVMLRVPGLQPAFEPLAPCDALERASGFADGGREVVEYWVSAEFDEDGAPRRTRSAESAALEARSLARELRELHDRHGVGWSEVGVLFRSRGNWDVYLGALRDAGVPYAVEGDRTYYRRREILDAASLVASILDPNDLVSLVALLRSSVGGVPDAAWIPLWEGRLPALAARLGGAPGALEAIADLLEKTAEEIADAPGLVRIAGWQHVAFACLEAVAALRRSFARDPADVFVERLRETLGFELSEAARFLGAWRAANLERFFGDLAAWLAAGEPVAVLLRRLRGAMAEDETPSVEPKPPEAADAVTVATLHGAKGLAWGHVYLMQLHKGASNVAARGDLRREDGWLETSWGRWRTLGYDVVEARSRQVSEAERVRTLYVGMTRAKRRLVLCGLRPEVQQASRESHATLLESRAPAPPALEVLAREAAAHGGAICAAGARWVFPAQVLAGEESGGVVAEPEAPAALEARATPPLPGAAARMALPRGVSVSSLAEGGTETERAAREAEGDAARSGSPAGALAARCVGTAIHAALESMNGLFSGGRTALHIITSSSAPEAAAMRIATPRIRATPMPRRAAMNSQSAQASPAMPL